MPKGYLSLVLHAHLPFVRHPEHEEHLEERWLFEAITETYIPLISVYNGLRDDDVPFRITMSLTPPLLNMLADPLLQERYLKHLDKSIELAEKEILRTRRQDPRFEASAETYRNLFIETRNVFVDRYDMDLVRAFREIQQAGGLEIITCGATHAFLPLFKDHPESIRAQILVAAEDYERRLGVAPKGIWLPECGYFPGVENYLEEAGIRYFLVDTHGIDHAEPRPVRGVYSPILCPNGVAAFARDMESSKQVWSSTEGYPGDYDYREFYRDIGFDLPMEYVGPYINPDGTRLNTGIKYYKITGRRDLSQCEPYDWTQAGRKAADHAGNFMFNREKQVEWLEGSLGRRPIVVAPYDAELFGHWWFEGPRWLDVLIRKIHFDQDVLELATPSDYLDLYPDNQVATPSASSWGDKGYSEVWCNATNDWIYPHLHKLAERMHELAGHPRLDEAPVLRIVRQAGREFLLAQASDWAFIMTNETTVEYARQRTIGHVENFNRLYDMLKNGEDDEAFLEKLEKSNSIFPELDVRHWR